MINAFLFSWIENYTTQQTEKINNRYVTNIQIYSIGEYRHNQRVLQLISYSEKMVMVMMVDVRV